MLLKMKESSSFRIFLSTSTGKWGIDRKEGEIKVLIQRNCSQAVGMLHFTNTKKIFRAFVFWLECARLAEKCLNKNMVFMPLISSTYCNFEAFVSRQCGGDVKQEIKYFYIGLFKVERKFLLTEYNFLEQTRIRV